MTEIFQRNNEYMFPKIFEPFRRLVRFIIKCRECGAGSGTTENAGLKDMKARLCLKMVVVVASFAFGTAHVHSQTTNIVYAYTDLGSLGGEKAIAYGINNSGQVVGESDVPGTPAEPHAFLYSGGVMTDLGVLGGSSFLSNSVAQAINNEGQIVGYSTATNAGTGGYHAFLY